MSHSRLKSGLTPGLELGLKLRLAGCAAALALSATPALAENTERLPGQTPAAGSLEAGLWEAMSKAERETQQSGQLNAAPDINAYTRSVVCKVAAAYCPELRLYVMDRPFMNALMAPNGYSEVWSGLLLLAQDESELAFVLGHEFSHFRQNDSLDQFVTMKRNANTAMALKFGIAIIAMGAQVNTGSVDTANSISDGANALMTLTDLAAAAAFFGFSREQETEADQAGLKAASAAGYDAAGAARLWQAVIDQTQASDFEKVRKSESRSTIFRSHPLTQERITALSAQAASLPKPTITDSAKRHRAAIRPHLSTWLRDNLRLKDYGQSFFLLDRLAKGGEDLGLINYFRGEAYRLRRNEGDLLKAREHYVLASAHADAPVAVWREIGDLYAKEGRTAEARTAFQTYLERAPKADDAWLVEDSLTALSKAAPAPPVSSPPVSSSTAAAPVQAAASTGTK